MVGSGLIDRIEPGAYRLGIRLVELGNLVKSRISVRQEALPFMQRLHEALGESVNLGVRHVDDVVYIERVAAGNAMMRVVQVVGMRTSLHATAAGKIFLAQDGPAGCAAYAERAGLPRVTGNTICERDALVREIEAILAQGYAFDNEEAEIGVSCIAAGIYDDESQIVAGLSVSAPSDRLRKEWARDVVQTAKSISRAIGFRG
jgi:DNA-binding IclR family transcriptional regulator